MLPKKYFEYLKIRFTNLVLKMSHTTNKVIVMIVCISGKENKMYHSANKIVVMCVHLVKKTK